MPMTARSCALIYLLFVLFFASCGGPAALVDPAQEALARQRAERQRAASQGEWVTYRVGAVQFRTRWVNPADGKDAPIEVMETEVTQALYEEVMRDNPSHFKGMRDSPQRPVENVSWEDGVAFANALSQRLNLQPVYEGQGNSATLVAGATGFRLLSESEWAWAVGCGQSEPASVNIETMAWYDGSSGQKTSPVGLRAPNSCGLRDMNGNVWEWTADDYDNPGEYQPGATERVFRRGGGWCSDAERCRVSFRGGDAPSRRLNLLGLRFSRSLE